LGFEGNLKCDTVFKKNQVLKIGFNKFKSIAGYKNTSLLHLCVKGANGIQGEKECSTTFLLEVIWDPVKAFPDE
jgi:hypothetical protein